MSTLLRAGPDVIGGLRAADNGDESNLLGAAEVEGDMPIITSGGRSGVVIDTPTKPARCDLGVMGGGTPQPLTGEAQTYKVSLPKRLQRLRCLVEGCLGGALNRTNFRVHFAHPHTRYTIVILEEGNRPCPRFLQCSMFVSRKALNGWYMATAF